MRARLPLLGLSLLVSIGLTAPPAAAAERPVRPKVTTVWTAPQGTAVLDGFDLATTGPGQATVAWWADQRPGRRLLVASSPDWAPQVITTEPVADEKQAPSLSGLDVVRGPEGAVVVWKVDQWADGLPDELYAATQVAGGWSRPVSLASARFVTVNAVGTDDAGVTVLWSSCDDVCNDRRLEVARLADGAWRTTVLATSGAVQEPRLVRDAPDSSTVYWLTREAILGSTWQGSGWSPVAPVFARATPGLDGSLQADATVDGTTVLAWRATADRPGWVAAVRAGGAWSPPTPIANVIDTFFPPQVDAVSARGTPTLLASGTSPRCCAEFSVQKWSGDAWLPATAAEWPSAGPDVVTGEPWDLGEQAKAWGQRKGRLDHIAAAATPTGGQVLAVGVSPTRRTHVLGVRRMSEGRWGPLLKVTGPAGSACMTDCEIAAPDDRSAVLAWTTPRAVKVTALRP